MSFVRSLHGYASRPAAHTPRARCEICGSTLDGGHRHVLERATRSILCSCAACAILFGDDRASGGRYRAVPDRVLVDPGAVIDDAWWRGLGVPVGLAFVVGDSPAQKRRCVYPSPAGPVEAEIDDGAWREFAARLPLADAARDDVEALLVRRRRDGSFSCFVAPIDECYAMVGAVRARWRGLDGGDAVRRTIDEHFERLQARSRPVGRGGEP